MSWSDDDLLSRVFAMSGANDDDDEIRKLREVHSAFRELPDEEPPQRGLAELMAAARVKAEEMKPAPWWRALFRPPMLALATVMVLVGGAVLIGRHGDSMKAESPTAPAGTVTSRDNADLALDKGPAPGSATTKSLEVATDRPAEENEKQAPHDEDGAAKAGNGEAAHRDVVATPPAQPAKPTHTQLAGAGNAGSGNAAPTPRPTQHAARPPAPDQAPAVPRSETAPPPAPPAPPKIDPGSTTTGTSVSGGATAGDIGGKGKAAQDDAAEDSRKKDDAKKEAPTTPAPEATSQRRGGPREPSIDQLVQQCQAAATRGDCTAAKSIAARIKKASDQAYRARVVNDAAIAKCLE